MGRTSWLVSPVKQTGDPRRSIHPELYPPRTHVAAPKPEPKATLLDRVIEAVHLGGWNASVADRTEYPFEVEIASEEERDSLLLYIWNISHGGGRLRPEREFRVQLTFPGQKANEAGRIDVVEGRKTLLLGHFEREGTEGFVGWDPTQHRTPGWSASVQVRLDTILGAIENGMAMEERKREAGIVTELAVAFRAEILVPYIRDIYPNYQPAQVSASEMEAIAPPPTGVRTLIPEPQGLPRERGRALRRFLQLERSATFSLRVLDAYGNRCAMCGLQLRVLDAAHIVPVAERASTDSTDNGLALCPTHHRAYDRALIGVAEDGTITLNARSVGALKAAGYGGGVDEFRAWSRVGEPIFGPSDPDKAPSPANLREGLRLRGFTRR